MAYRVAIDPRVTFDEATHVYSFLGKRLYGVTECLRPVTPDFAKYFTPEGRARGTRVHKMVEYEVDGTLDIGALDDELLGYLEQWMEFRALVNFKPILCEQMVFHEPCHFAGKLDLYGELDGHPALIDIKSGVVDWHMAGPQTSGYKSAAEYMGLIPYATRRYVLDLKQDRWNLSAERISKLDHGVFFNCLGITKYNDGFYDRY